MVVACRREDGRWLCIRRSATVAAPLKVCFPGGAVEVGESQESALVREMREELGIEVAPISCLWRWDSPSTPLTLWGWIADHQQKEPRPDPAEVAEILWLSGAEIAAHPDAMPTNASFVAALSKHLDGLPAGD